MVCHAQVLTHIILPQMDSIGAYSEGHIDTIIDDQGHARELRDPQQLSRHPNEFSGIALLVSVLYNRDTYIRKARLAASQAEGLTSVDRLRDHLCKTTITKKGLA